MFGRRFFYLSSLILLISFFLSTKIKESEPILQNPKIDQIEIKKKGPLLNSDGQLIDVGWSRYPLKDYNLDEIDLPFLKKFYFKLRIKKWDFFSIINENFIIFVALVDVGYLGQSFIHIVDLKTKEKFFIDLDILPIFKPKFFKDSYNFTLKESFYYQASDYILSYEDCTLNEHSQIKYRSITFATGLGSQKIVGNFTIEKARVHEDIVTMTPMSNDKTRFFYNVKSYTLPVLGTLQIGDKVHNFDKNSSSAGMDFGRGIWNYNSFWVWSSGNGFLKNGSRFGINLGGGFQDFIVSQATEDSFFIDGKLNKLNVAIYTYPEEVGEGKWQFKTENDSIIGSCDVRFEKRNFNLKEKNFYLLMTRFKQFFGVFSGWVISEEGEKIEFEEVWGVGEVHRTRW